MTKLNLTENELAERWGVSPKTLQRWRTDGRGPSYLKLSKRVAYSIEDILAFESSQKRVRENSHEVAVQRSAISASAQGADPTAPGNPQTGLVAQDDSVFITVAEVTRATKLPRCYFTRVDMRAELEIPHYFVGKQVRFKLEEIRQWEIAQAQQSKVSQVDRIASIFQNAKSTPDKPCDPSELLQHRDHDRRPHAGCDASTNPAMLGTAADASEPPRMGLHEALRRLNAGTLPPR